jgi:hypothetical protein
VRQPLPSNWNWPSSRRQRFFAHPFLFPKTMSEQQKKQSFVRPVTDEAILKATKEIMVKFIEIGRVTPGNFEENYEKVFNTVKQSAEELNSDSAA